MKIRVQVIVESDDGVGEIVQEIAQLERGQLRPEELGLTLAETKGLLEGLQRTVVERQIAEYSKQQSSPAPVSLSVPAAAYPQLQSVGGVTRRENVAGASLSRGKVCISRLLWTEYEAL